MNAKFLTKLSTASLVVVLGLFALPSCGAAADATPSQTSNFKPPPRPTVSAPQAASPAPVGLPTQTVTKQALTEDGKSQTVTITIGPVLTGVDLPLVKSEWTRLGGKATDISCLDLQVSSADGGFAVGTMAISNDTPSFPAADRGFQFEGNDSMYIGFGFGDPRARRSVEDNTF